MLHDVEEGGDDAGDGLEGGGGLTPLLGVHHRPQRIVQYASPHRASPVVESAASAREEANHRP